MTFGPGAYGAPANTGVQVNRVADQQQSASYQTPIVQQSHSVLEQPGARITQTSTRTQFFPSSSPLLAAPAPARLVKVDLPIEHLVQRVIQIVDQHQLAGPQQLVHARPAQLIQLGPHPHQQFHVAQPIVIRQIVQQEEEPPIVQVRVKWSQSE